MREGLSRMTDNPSKLAGVTDTVLGATKEVIGTVVGNESLQEQVHRQRTPLFFLIFLLSVKGQEQKEQGQAKLEAARAQQDRMGRVEQFEGKAKQIYGIITGDDAVSFCSLCFLWVR